MKTTTTWAVALLLLAQLALGQNARRFDGRVSDEKGAPLPYVNIGIVGTALGTVSGPDGLFTLFLPDGIPGEDTLRFSMLGHESRSFSLTDFPKQAEGGAVVLPAAAIALREVVVRPRFLRQKQLGMERPGTKRSVNFAIGDRPNQNLGAEVGRKFNLPKGPVQLDRFRFFIAHNNFDTVRLRVNIYSLAKGRPGDNLAPRNIIVELTKGQKGWVDVDLSPYSLVVEEDVVLAVEWVYHAGKGNSLSIPIAMPTPGPHYYKYGSQATWKRFRGMSAALGLEVSY